MKITKVVGIGALSLFAASVAFATNWQQDVPLGATWSGTNNWVQVHAPGTNDSAIFITSQANTLDVDVDVASQVVLLQVGQEYIFNGAGSLSIRRELVPGDNFLMYNTTAGKTVTYNVPLSISTYTTDSINRLGQPNNTSGGTTVFNDTFTLESGSWVNWVGGTYEFNGDLDLQGETFRVGTAKVVIGGTGTTTMSMNYFLLPDPAGELHLARENAYVPPSTGFLRVEKGKVFLDAPNAMAPDVKIRMYQTDPGSALISGGDFDQNLGVFYVQGGVPYPVIIDMQNTACMWTFVDCSHIGWDVKGLDIINVHSSNTVIRFKMEGVPGTGLTETQISRTRINGVQLTLSDVTIIGGYLYITPAISVPIPDIIEPGIISSELVSSNIVKIVVDTPSAVDRYWPEGVSDLVTGSWTNVAHSDDGANDFVITNLAYSTEEGTNKVIYVEADVAAEFFKIMGE